MWEIKTDEEQRHSFFIQTCHIPTKYITANVGVLARAYPQVIVKLKENLTTWTLQMILDGAHTH